MKPYIPYEKLSKKQQRIQNAAKRGSWNGLNPVTRKSKNRKIYHRKRAQNWKNDFDSALFLLQLPIFLHSLWRRFGQTSYPFVLPEIAVNKIRYAFQKLIQF